MKKLIGVGAVLLAGCGGANANLDSGPVILQCDGDITLVTLGAVSTKRQRYHVKIDKQKESLQIFNGETFVNWGDGKPKISQNEISFISKDTAPGRSGFALRNMTIDRSSGRMTDKLETTLGAGSQYEGECAAVSEPEPLDQKF